MTVPIPTLRTERLLMQPPGPECDEAYVAFYTDARASRAYGGPLSAEAAQARRASDLHAWQVQGFGVWALHLKDVGGCIGVCGFWQGAGWPRELTWWLLPAARGSGLAQEASRAAIAQAYGPWQWPVVETTMNDENSAARSLALRLGAVVARREPFPDGLERTIYRLPP